MLAQNSTLKTTPAIPAARGVVNRWSSAGELDLATGHTFSTTFAVTKGRRFARQPVLRRSSGMNLPLGYPGRCYGPGGPTLVTWSNSRPSDLTRSRAP